MSATELQERLKALGDARVAASSRRFFKTGPGEYGAGDLFRGIRVPVLRALAKEYQSVSSQEAGRLLRSPFHEDRLLALLLLVRLYARGDEAAREKIYRLYLKNTRYINNWDLVDSSAEHIVGAHLRERGRGPLRLLAKSADLWERRIAVLATFHYVKRGEFEETFRVARALLSDREDLIHKAVGWMLREVGKRDPLAEDGFLKKHYRRMPRTMLRYAVERFPEEKRRRYLKGEV
ncbi:MAG TPA: DNA alkylation repair protein [Pyrinomonadaceae bacterium]